MKICSTVLATLMLLSSGVFASNATNKPAAVSKNASMRMVTNNYTVLSTDDTIFADAGAGALTVALPPAIWNKGKSFKIKKIDSNNDNYVMVDPNASETIDGQADFTLSYKNQVIDVVCDGSQWHILSFNAAGEFRTVTKTAYAPNPATSDLYYNLGSSHSLTLSKGTFKLKATALYYYTSGGTPKYSFARLLIAQATGTGTTSSPTALASGNITIVSGAAYNDYIMPLPQSSPIVDPYIPLSNYLTLIEEVSVKVTSSTTVYIVPYASMQTPGEALIETTFSAERIY